MPDSIEHRPSIPADVEKELRRIIDYLWQEEKDSFECCPLHERGDHIFKSLIVVGAWLDGNQDPGE